MEKHPDYKEINLFDVPYYEALIFDRASANYYLKKIKEAEKDLIELSNRFPGNDKYKNWKNATKVYKLNRTENFLYYLVAAAIIANLFLDESYGFFWRLRIIFLIAGLAGIAIIERVNRPRKNGNSLAGSGLYLFWLVCRSTSNCVDQSS